MSCHGVAHRLLIIHITVVVCSWKATKGSFSSCSRVVLLYCDRQKKGLDLYRGHRLNIVNPNDGCQALTPFPNWSLPNYSMALEWANNWQLKEFCHWQLSKQNFCPLQAVVPDCPEEVPFFFFFLLAVQTGADTIRKGRQPDKDKRSTFMTVKISKRE